MKKRARERAATTAAEAEVVVAAKEKVAETEPETEPETEKVAVTEAAAATVEAEKDGATEAEAAKVDAEKAATDATRTGACDEPDHIIRLAHFATISYTPVLHLHPIHKTGVHNHPTHPTTAGIPQPVGRPRSGMMWDRVKGEWIHGVPFPPSDIHMCQ